MFVSELTVQFFPEREQLFLLEVSDRHPLPGATRPL